MTTRVQLPSTRVMPGDAFEPRGLGSYLVDFAELLITLWRNKVRIVGAGVAVATLAALYLVTLDSVYTAESSVQLDTRGEQIINIENIVDRPTFSDSTILTEIAVVRSKPLLREVALRLNLAQYEEFNPSLRTPSPVGVMIGGIRSMIRGLFVEPSAPGEPPPPHHVAADILAGQLTVSQLGLSFILVIKVEAGSPDRAAAIANTIAQVYLERQVEAKLAATRSATEWLGQREVELRSRVEAAENRLEALRGEIVAQGRFSNPTIERQIDAFSGQLVLAQAEQAMAFNRAARFDELVAAGDLTAAMQIASSAKLTRLIERRDNILQQRAAIAQASPAPADSLAASLGPVETAIAEETRELSTGLHALAQIAVEQSQQIERKLIDLENALFDQSVEMVELRTLEREVIADRAVYERFLNRLTEARERGDFQQADAQIVSFADPPGNASSPKRTLLTIAAFVLGSGLAAAVILLLDSRKQVFRTAAEASSRIGIPVLAAIPAEGPRRRDRWRRPSPEVAHAVRRLALQADPAGSDAHRVLLLASALPDEGAPELAVLLAQAVACSGARVAILDADPRPGSLLDGLAPTSDELQQASGLSFDICAIKGAGPASAADVRRAATTALIARLRQTYDLVIISAPPVLASLDALRSAPSIDSVLLVFAWEQTPEGALREAVQDLSRLEAPLAGLVMTGVEPRVAALYEYWGAASARARVKSYLDDLGDDGTGVRAA